MKKTLTCLMLLCLLWAPACAKRRIAQLSERTDVYNRSLRWASLASAGRHITESRRKTMLEKLSTELDKNNIIDFSVLDLGLDKEKKEGSVIVEFTYVRNVSQVMGKRREMQHWRYEPKHSNWFLVDIKDLGRKQ